MVFPTWAVKEHNVCSKEHKGLSLATCARINSAEMGKGSTRHPGRDRSSLTPTCLHLSMGNGQPTGFSPTKNSD